MRTVGKLIGKDFRILLSIRGKGGKMITEDTSACLPWLDMVRQWSASSEVPYLHRLIINFMGPRLCGDQTSSWQICWSRWSYFYYQIHCRDRSCFHRLDDKGQADNMHSYRSLWGLYYKWPRVKVLHACSRCTSQDAYQLYFINKDSARRGDEKQIQNYSTLGRWPSDGWLCRYLSGAISFKTSSWSPD